MLVASPFAFGLVLLGVAGLGGGYRVLRRDMSSGKRLFCFVVCGLAVFFGWFGLELLLRFTAPRRR